MGGLPSAPQLIVLVEPLLLLSMHCLVPRVHGLPSIWHNEIRDLTATLLTEMCSQVVVEPELQPVFQPVPIGLSVFHQHPAGSHTGHCNEWVLGWKI